MSAPVAEKRSVLGLDIGGANIKLAHVSGFTRHAPFALWKNPRGLAKELRTLLSAAPAHDALAVTMTGELCDCFDTKREGVAAILDSVESSTSRPVLVWTTEGTFLDPTRAKANPLKVASANWLALAVMAGRLAPEGSALLIDIGTTTTDIIPIVDGKPVPLGRTDPERLESDELVYRGWRRTPLCIFVGDGAAELFAKTHDVYLVLKMVPEEESDLDTANGKPATRDHAYRRLARMMCSDMEMSTPEECEQLAVTVNLRLTTTLANAVARVIKRLPSTLLTVVSSGSGEFLMPMIFRSPVIDLPNPQIMSLAQMLSPAYSSSACALAVAMLAAE